MTVIPVRVARQATGDLIDRKNHGLGPGRSYYFKFTGYMYVICLYLLDHIHVISRCWPVWNNHCQPDELLLLKSLPYRCPLAPNSITVPLLSPDTALLLIQISVYRSLKLLPPYPCSITFHGLMPHAEPQRNGRFAEQTRKTPTGDIARNIQCICKWFVRKLASIWR